MSEIGHRLGLYCITTSHGYYSFLAVFREFLSSYNKLSEVCFTDCVWDFTTRSVKSQEEKCALNCTEKYLKMVQRVSQRFQEFQMITNENAIAAAQKLGGSAR